MKIMRCDNENQISVESCREMDRDRVWNIGFRENLEREFEE